MSNLFYFIDQHGHINPIVSIIYTTSIEAYDGDYTVITESVGATVTDDEGNDYRYNTFILDELRNELFCEQSMEISEARKNHSIAIINIRSGDFQEELDTYYDFGEPFYD